MADSAEYFKIIKCIENEFSFFDKCFESRIKKEIPAKFGEILDFYFSKKGKRLRPALIFLILKSMGLEIAEKHYLLAFANEMIHNATLLHDDIIDNAAFRHSLPALNALYDNKMAVLAGDYLLSLALEALSELGAAEVIKIHANSISNLISGEIGQYFEKDSEVTIEQYIEKSKNKTAELFRTGIAGAVALVEQEIAHKNEIEAFALNFGIAFQIKNDLGGLEEDIKNGVKTAPIIYYKELTQKPLSVEAIQNSAAIEKTKNLIRLYTGRAIENIAFIEDNQYKKAICDLCRIINQ